MTTNGQRATLASNLKNGSFAEVSGPFAFVELFTSEGCSSCPPADELLSNIIDEASDKKLPVFALGFHVDYWDFQGWPDRFATAEHSARQYTYAATLGTGSVYTPQIVVNGAVEFVGSNQAEAWREITTALARAPEGAVMFGADRSAEDSDSIVITYEVDALQPAVELNLAVVERGLVVDVATGENAGRTLHHDNVVRAFGSQRLTGTQGRTELCLPPDLDAANSSVFAFVQEADTGRIIVAAGCDVPVPV